MKRMLLAALCAAGLSTAAFAQQYPTKPITMIVPFAAGGATDVTARLIAEGMSEALGQRIVIENIGGAGGTLGVQRAIKTAPDGYTLLAGHTGTNAAAFSLYKTPRYDPRSDLEMIGLVASSPIVVIAQKGLAANNVPEFRKLAAERGDKLTFAHSGVGSLAHLTCTLFNDLIGAKPTQVTYRGNGPLTADLMAGHVDYSCDQVTVTAPQISGGTAKGVTIAGDKRSSRIPDVPTSAEGGLPEFNATGWVALFAPKGVPEPILKALNDSYRKALADPKLRMRLDELGAFPPSDAEQSREFLAGFIAREVDSWGAVVKRAGIVLD